MNTNKNIRFNLPTMNINLDGILRAQSQDDFQIILKEIKALAKERDAEIQVHHEISVAIAKLKRTLNRCTFVQDVPFRGAKNDWNVFAFDPKDYDKVRAIVDKALHGSCISLSAPGGYEKRFVMYEYESNSKTLHAWCHFQDYTDKQIRIEVVQINTPYDNLKPVQLTNA